MCFSGGKDSALALRALGREGRFRVERLITTVTDAYDRVSMHGVRRSLARRQAELLDLPLVEVPVPPDSSNAVYESAMAVAFGEVRRSGIRRVAFGDIFLQDLREYREAQMAACGLECVFPRWGQSTRRLAADFVKSGFRAITVCVSLTQLPVSFVGRDYDESFLADLPPDADPCGENGEFHTFVRDGPVFPEPIPVARGEVVERAGFAFCDLLPG